MNAKDISIATVKMYNKNDDGYQYIPVMLLLPIFILDYEK